MSAFADSKVAMLDLITNVLAAVLILFFIMSAFQPPPPRPRVCETVLVDVELDDTMAMAGLWLQPAGATRPDDRLLDDEIPNAKRVLQGGACHEGLDEALTESGELLVPTVMLYRTARSNRRLAVVRGPTVGLWHVGVLYRGHPRITRSEQPVSATIRVWNGSQAKGQIGVAGRAVIEGSTGAAVGPLLIEDRDARTAGDG